jgi:hypothetical protein
MKLQDSNDYNVNKITMDKAKIVYLQKLKQYTNDNTDIKTISINKEISETDRNILFEEYNIMFNNRSVKKTFQTDTHLCEFISKIYKQLFGNDIINTHITKQKNKDGKRTDVRTYSINEDVINTCNTLYSFRHTPTITTRIV